jgi:hypothetical protein
MKATFKISAHLGEVLIQLPPYTEVLDKGESLVFALSPNDAIKLADLIYEQAHVAALSKLVTLQLKDKDEN